jgi:hypothetical protein
MVQTTNCKYGRTEKANNRKKQNEPILPGLHRMGRIDPSLDPTPHPDKTSCRVQPQQHLFEKKQPQPIS